MYIYLVEEVTLENGKFRVYFVCLVNHISNIS